MGHSNINALGIRGGTKSFAQVTVLVILPQDEIKSNPVKCRV